MITSGSSYKPLTRYYVAKLIKQIARLSGRNDDQFNTHSFRAGGACALWAMRYSATEIQMLGRWRSDTWKIYVTQADSRLRDVTHHMASAGEDCLLYASLQDKLRVSGEWPVEVRPESRQFAIGF